MPRAKVSITSPDSPLKCLAVYRLSDQTLVALHCPAPNPENAYKEVMRKILASAAAHPRLTVTDPHHGAFHYETEREAIFFAITTAEYPQRVVFQCIDELKARFMSGLSGPLAVASEGGLSKPARQLLTELFARFSDPASVDKTLSVTRQVGEVRGIVGETIAALLSSQENLEVLEDRSEALREQAQTFKKTSTAVKVVQKKKNTRLLSITCFVLIFAVAAVSAPIVIMYWDEIVDFFKQMLPPSSTTGGSSQGGELLLPDAAWYGTPPISLQLPPHEQELTFFAHGSCADQQKPQHFWSTLQGANPELFIFNGDLVYGDCTSASECDELPAAWKGLFHNPLFQSASAVLPMMGILDDHDYGKNDCDVSWEGKSYAKELFLERFNVSQDDERRGREGLYRYFNFGPPGKRTQIILLDTRWFRSSFVKSNCGNAFAPECAGIERYVEYAASESAQHTILGTAQWDWLHAVLLEPADLRVIVSTIQILPTGHGWERWGLIPTEVEKLANLIRETQANGVVLLSGDRHTGGIYKLPKSINGTTGAPYDLYEITSSSLSHSFRTDEDEAGPRRLGNLTHYNNFGTIAVDWSGRSVKLDLRASDDCGLSPQAWHHVCVAPSGTPGALLMELNISLADLVVNSTSSEAGPPASE